LITATLAARRLRYRWLLAVVGLWAVSAFSTVAGSRLWVIVYLLFVPLLVAPSIVSRLHWRAPWGEMMVALAMLAALLFWQPGLTGYALLTLLLAALPEEWFFRAGMQDQLGNDWLAVVLSSAAFAISHGILVSWLHGGLVFLPSLCFGALYRWHRSLPLVVLIHALSNVILRAVAPAGWI